jgi:hypothetical protein
MGGAAMVLRRCATSLCDIIPFGFRGCCDL